MFSIRFNRWTIAAFAFAALMAPRLDDGADARSSRRQFGAVSRAGTISKSLTTSGSYLAARHASVERDAASAAAFYRSALRTDPKNNELLDRAFISSVAEGDIDEAVKLADRILAVDKSNRVARLVVGVQRHEAEEICRRPDQHQPVDSRADHRSGGDAAVGLGQLRRRRRQGGGRQYRQADRAGMVPAVQGSARRHDFRSGRQGKGRRRALRAGLQARRFHAARGRQPMRAGCRATRTMRRRLAIYEAFDKKLARHPLVLEGLRETKAGKKLPPLVDSAAGRRRRGALRHRRHADRAAAARISRWSICSLRSISRPIIRWRCCRSPISMSRSRSRRWRSRSTSACRRVRR